MMRMWKKGTIGLAAAALVLTAGASAGRAMAYFTTYVTASGGYVLNLGSAVTELEETVSNWTKTVTIRNTGDGACYVRVRAFAGSPYQEALEYTGTNWTKSGDYYYYTKVLEAGTEQTPAMTDPIEIHIKGYENAEDDFNVIVIQESVPVFYNDSGEPEAWDKIDWSASADVVKQGTADGGEVTQ